MWRDIVDYYIPLVITGAFALLIMVIRITLVNRKEQRNAFDELNNRVTIHGVTQDTLVRDVERLKRAFPTTRENLAVIVREFEAHQRWHERHPG